MGYPLYPGSIPSLVARAIGRRFGTEPTVWREGDDPVPPEPSIRLAVRGSDDDHYNGRTTSYHVDGLGIRLRPEGPPITLHLELTHHELSGDYDVWTATVRGAGETHREFFAALLDPRRSSLLAYPMAPHRTVHVDVE